jgi:hypothetical protein
MTLPFSENDLPTEPSSSAASNPFATRYTRPNVGQFVFPPGGEADSLIAQLQAQGWWGQITGPHGSGKSTLVYTLLPKLRAAGRHVEFHSLHASAERHAGGLPLDAASRAVSGSMANSLHSYAPVPSIACWRDSIASWNASTQIVVDGCEQLGWLQRTWLKWNCRRRGTGLLVTAHRDVGLPPLWTAQPSVELAQRVVARLLGQDDAGWLRGEQVERLFAEHRGNVRELLFALYDLYEQRNAGGR